MKKLYQVLRTLGLAGTIHEIGHVIALEGSEVKNLILGGFIKEKTMTDGENAAPAEEVKPPVAPESTPAPEAAPAEEKPAEGSEAGADAPAGEK